MAATPFQPAHGFVVAHAGSDLGAVVSAASVVEHYATRSATRREKGGYERAFEFPGFVPAYIRAAALTSGALIVPLHQAARSPPATVTS